MGAFRQPGGLDPLLAGTLGGLLTTWVTFVPCFLWIFLGAPWIERLRGHRALGGALAAITAAVVGVVLNLALWFAAHSLFAELRPVRGDLLHFDLPLWSSVDWAALALTAATLVATFRFRIGTVPLLVGSAVAGVAWWAVGR
jgi:chromate transporter